MKYRRVYRLTSNGNQMRQSVEFSAEGKDTDWKNKACFSLLSATFSPSLHFPSSLLSHSICPDNTALIIAELHRDNHSLESRAAAAKAVWENPSSLLQPACLPADCARMYMY